MVRLKPGADTGGRGTAAAAFAFVIVKVTLGTKRARRILNSAFNAAGCFLSESKRAGGQNE